MLIPLWKMFLARFCFVHGPLSIHGRAVTLHGYLTPKLTWLKKLTCRKRAAPKAPKKSLESYLFNTEEAECYFTLIVISFSGNVWNCE